MANPTLKGGVPTSAYQTNTPTVLTIDQDTGPHASGYFWNGTGGGTSAAQNGMMEPVPFPASDITGFTNEGYI